MAKGVPFNGSWHVERHEDVSGPYVRGTEAVSIPLLAGTSFAVLTGIVGGGRQDYNVTLTPDPGRETPVQVYSARNMATAPGVLWLGTLDPAVQHTLHVQPAAHASVGLYKLQQYGDRWVQLRTGLMAALPCPKTVRRTAPPVTQLRCPPHRPLRQVLLPRRAPRHHQAQG